VSVNRTGFVGRGHLLVARTMGSCEAAGNRARSGMGESPMKLGERNGRLPTAG